MIVVLLLAGADMDQAPTLRRFFLLPAKLDFFKDTKLLQVQLTLISF